MMKIRTSLLALVLVLAGTVTAAAQTEPLVAFGDRVRVVSPEVRGAFLVKEFRGDTLVLQGAQPHVEVSLPLSAVESLERSLGRYHEVGIVLGSLIGTGVGVAIPFVVVQFTGNREDAFAVLLTFPLGMVVGAAIGHRNAPEQWVPVNFPARASIVPTGSRGLGVSLSFDF